MTTHDGGENVDDALAPVIPLFGSSGSRRDAVRAGSLPSPRHPAGKALRGDVRRLPVAASTGEDAPGAADEWHPAWTADPRRTDPAENAAAVRDAAARFGGRQTRSSTTQSRDEFGRARGRRDLGGGPDGKGDRGETTERSKDSAADALDWLLRALRRKPISVSEARRELGSAGYDDSDSDAAVEECLRLGYLDDARLAEQLTYIGAERKRQGRSAIARTLSERGIARSVSEEALEPLAADEGERAREFADKKARTMSSLPRDVALRRLVGQLSRRGFGAVALDVARAALDDAASSDGPYPG